jgi:hypothetical protein
VLVDGRAVATWRLQRSGEVTVQPFDTVPGGEALEAEVADIGRFLARETRPCVS